MIHKKEFYFIRHGQTDFNVSNAKVDHDDVSLNAVGFKQAQAVEPIMAILPIKSVCYSPLKRAKETKEVITSRLQVQHHEIPDLGECTMQIWDDMTASGVHALNSPHNHVKAFMQQALNGINQALSQEGPVLVVAHGGIHWAICCLMGISSHDWLIDNCLPVHFLVETEGHWIARKLPNNSSLY